MKSEVPFALKLEKSSYSARTVDLMKFKEHPEKLVRVYDINDQDIKKCIKDFSEGRQLFREMEQKYGIPVVAMDCVVGKNEKGEVVMYTIVDKIVGKALDTIFDCTPEMKDEFEDHYCSLAQYYHDKFATKEKYWSDPQENQFMYGHKLDEKKNRIYLVDVDPGFNEGFFNKKGEDSFEEILDSVWRMILRMEKKFKPPVKFTKARALMLKTMNMVAEEESSSR